MASIRSSSENIVETILNTRMISPEQVIEIRRDVWPDGTINRAEAEMIFEINDVLEHRCGEWDDLFAEAIVAHLIENADPRGYISESDAAWFEERIKRDDAICGTTELETLIQLLEKAIDAPERLEILALETVRNAVLEGDYELLGNARLRQGVLGDPEVALLRRVIYAKAAGRSEAISRAEADLLFDLNDATVCAENCSAWSALFVNAISNYLLVQSGYEPPSRERMKQIDLWLNQPSDGKNGFLKEMANGIGRGSFFSDVSDIFNGITPMEEYYASRVNADAQNREAAEHVNAQEAAWLCARIGRDGALTPNERAVLLFLKAGRYDLDAALDPLMKRIG